MDYLKYGEIQYDGVMILDIDIDEEHIPYCIEWINRYISYYNTEINGNILFTRSDSKRIKFIIPIKYPVVTCEHYEYQPYFRIENYVVAYHYNKFSKIKDTCLNVSKFLKKNNLKAAGKPYYYMEHEYMYIIYIPIA